MSSSSTAPVPRAAWVRTLAIVVGYWALLSGAAIEIYARRYEYAGTALLPDAALALAVLGVFFIPGSLRDRLPAARAALAALVLGAAAFFAVRQPLQAVHLLLVLSVLGLALLGAWLASVAPIPRWSRRLLTALVLATVNFLLFAYYVILFIGREAWNQVVSRELLWTYFRQLPEFVAALPFDAWLPYAVVGTIYLAFFAGWLAVAGRVSDALVECGCWIARSCAATGRFDRIRLVAIGLGLVSLPVAAERLYEAAAYAPIPDPLVTTLFLEQTQPGTRNLRLAPDPATVARDREVAASYAAPAGVANKTLVLIVVDALRADQMGVYGHERDNTPFLARLHREGKLTRFDNAFSACTESFCGLLAIHASRFPHQLGTKNFGLSDVLKRAGYRNHFLLGGDHTGFYGLRAFYGTNIDEFRDGSSAQGYMNDDQNVVDWVAQLAPNDGTPRFLFLHLMSAHYVGKRHPQYRKWSRAGAGLVCCTSTANYVNHYHDGIHQADALIEQIFASLKAKRLLDDAIVIITADHGEMLGEAAHPNHGGPPLDPVIRVPLLIYDTDAFPYPPRALASVTDVAATFLDRIGAPVPAHWMGVSLARAEARRFTFAQGGSAYAVIGRFGDELYKYHFDRDARQERLFNLSRDRAEREALPLEAHPGVVRDLRGELQAQLPALREAR
jgi:hypothetical protein